MNGELAAEGAGPLLDPDCRDGKHASCIGPPCECECHTSAVTACRCPASQSRHLPDCGAGYGGQLNYRPEPVGADAEPGDLYGPPPGDDHESDTP